MIKHFPRGSVYRILSCLRKGDWQEAERWLRRAVKDVRGVSDATPETHPRLASFWEQFGDRGEALRGKRVRWLHLAELWDYLPNAAQPQPT
jgi:hypothetical protein